MAARSRVRREKRPVMWVAHEAVQADLPTLSFTSAQQADAAMTSLMRFTGNDGTVRRTIGDTQVIIESLGDHPNQDLVLELCIGLAYFDSNTDVDGQAVNTSLSTGVGPMSDAESNKWFFRCCVQIPLGINTLIATGENLVRQLPAGGALSLWGAASALWMWDCHIDSKSMRKLQGFNQPWLQLVVEGRTSSLVAVGDDVTVKVNALGLRQVLQTR